MNQLPYAHVREGKALKAALYLRVSTRDGRQSTDNQLIELRSLCQRMGYTISREYVDHASGKSSDRNQFVQMFKDASKRRFDIVLFWSLDRFSREGVLPTLYHLQTLSAYGIQWKSFTEQYLDSCGMFRDAVISILAAIAEQERIRISERVTAGISRVRQERISKKMSAAWGRKPKTVGEIPAHLSNREAARLFGVSKDTIMRHRKVSSTQAISMEVQQ